MKNRYNVFALSIALFLATGCAEDPANVGGNEPLYTSEYIAITTSVEPMEGDFPDEASTRGTPIYSQADMIDFGLFCTYTGGTDWTPDDPYDKIPGRRMIKNPSASEGDRNYWTYASGDPVRWETGAGTTANDRYTFFAYAPYEDAATNGISVVPAGVVSSTLVKPAGLPYIRYVVPTATSLQPDLAIASRRENVRPTGNAVSLAMRHALTAVGFKVIGNGEQIASIAVTGFSDKGLVSLDGDNIEWNLTRLAPNGSLLPSPAATAPITANWFQAGLVAGAAASNTGEVMADDGWLMMIPQTLTNDAKVRITFSDGRPDMEFALDTQQWQAGTRVEYTITVAIPTVVGVRNIGTASGVIGYVWNPGKSDHLTLTMAKDDGNDLNGYVYVAYFKLGSAVAIGSQDTGAFTVDDIVAWPTDWAETTNFATDRAALEAKFAGAANGSAAWDVVPDLRQVSTSPDLAQGIGDPCSYYFGPAWKTPTMAENTYFLGGMSTQGTAAIGYVNTSTYNITPASGVNPALGNFPSAPGGPYSMPFAGYRSSTVIGGNGYYWVADATASDARFMLFNSSTAGYTNTTQSVAMAVRCAQPVVATSLAVTPASQLLGWDAFSRGESVVYDVVADGDWVVTSTNSNFTITRAMNGTGYNGTITVTPNSDNTSTGARTFSIIVAVPRDTAKNQAVTVVQGNRGIRNAGNTPGTIGYYYNPGQPNHMQLTLDTDDGNDANGIVYVAYFKYNSLVAIGSQNNGNFSSNDLVAWPTEWATTTDYLTDRTAMEAKFSGVTSGAAAFAVFAGTSSMGTSDPTLAQGDACTRYFGSGWKMPTQAENAAFFGGMGTVAAGTYIYTAAAATANRPALGTFPNAPGAPAGSGGYSVPMSGNRAPGITTAIGGHYWVSGTSRNFMTLNSSTADYTTTNGDVAKQIRCQQVTP